MWNVLKMILMLNLCNGNIEINRIFNLMTISQVTQTDIKSYWEQGYSANDPNGDKHLSTVYDVLSQGNFRSARVDDWSLAPPNEVAILLFNLVGDLQFWMVFDTASVTSESLQSWVRAENLIGTSQSSVAMDTTNFRWNISGYQMALCSTSAADSAWFAVANRNLRDNNPYFPYFVVPLNSTIPFDILEDNQTVGLYQTELIKSFKYAYVLSIEMDVLAELNVGPVYLSEIKVDNFASTINIKEDFTIEYSLDECSMQNKVIYKNLGDVTPMVFKTNTLTRIATLRIQCLWINFERKMVEVNVLLYAPSSADNIQTFPYVVFRGFWYSGYNASGTSQVLNHLLSTIPDTELHSTSTSTLSMTDITTTSNDDTTSLEQTNTHAPIQTDLGTTSIEVTSYSDAVCLCSCVSVTEISIDIEKRIKQLKLNLTINKSSLSSYKRRLTSAEDGRRSSSYLGYFAGIILAAVMIFIVILDLTAITKDRNLLRRHKVAR